MKNWKLAGIAGVVVAFTSISAGVHAFSNSGEWHEAADGPFAAGGDIHGTGLRGDESARKIVVSGGLHPDSSNPPKT